MDNTGDVAKDREEDVDQQIRPATTLKEDTERREDDGKDDLTDVAVDKNVSMSPSSDSRGRCA